MFEEILAEAAAWYLEMNNKQFCYYHYVDCTIQITISY